MFHFVLVGVATQKFYEIMYFCPWRLFFILANSVDPDEMLPYVYFIWFFTVCQSTWLPVSRMRRVNG